MNRGDRGGRRRQRGDGGGGNAGARDVGSKLYSKRNGEPMQHPRRRAICFGIHLGYISSFGEQALC